jgi:hypothetical protein
MFGDNGQINTGLVWAIVTMLVAVAVGGIIFSTIHEETKTEADSLAQSTGDYDFASVSAWTLENVKPLTISHNSSDEWVDISASGSGAGTATVSQTLDVETGTGTIESATIEAAYHVENADNLNDENIYVRLYRGGSQVYEHSKNTSGTLAWTTHSSDVSNHITEDATYKVEVFVEADVAGTGFETNVDNVQLDIDAESTGEMTSDETGDGATTVFPLLVLVVIVATFVALIGVLKNM